MPLTKIKRILLIEGEKDSAQYIMSLLGSYKCADFEIVHKRTMADTLECIEESEEHIDLILLDLILPNSKGIHAFEIIKNLDECHDVPIIIISDIKDIGIDCIKRGAQDFIPKTGLNLDLLIRSMRYAIERRKNEIELEKTQERLRMALDATSDGIWDYDIRSNHIHVSSKYENLLGYNDGALNGSIEKMLDIMHPEDRERLVNKNMISFCEKEVSTHNDNVYKDEFRLKDINGEYRWFLVRSMCINSKNNIPERLVGVLVDITDRKIDEISRVESFNNLSNILEKKLDEWNQEIKENKLEQDKKLSNIIERMALHR